MALGLYLVILHAPEPVPVVAVCKQVAAEHTVAAVQEAHFLGCLPAVKASLYLLSA
jgi:hypothetical protein